MLIDPEVAIPIFKELRDAGVVPCGLGARDTLRLEVCYPLHGNELTTERNPIEADLGWCCKEATGFLGSPTIAAARAEGTPERLVPFTIEGGGIPRDGNPVLGAGGRSRSASVTSGTFAPSLGIGAGMAYVESAPRRAGYRGRDRRARQASTGADSFQASLLRR